MDSDLAKFRAEKGISLHEISTKLNIPDKFLLAIEELNFDELPAPIFAKSQIKKYCAFFDLEPSIILEKYENFLKEKNISNEFQPNEIFKASDLMVDSLTQLISRIRSNKEN